MDQDNYDELVLICPSEIVSKIKLFLEFAPHLDERDVPDPYYGGPNGFEHVVDLIEHASIGLLDAIKKQLD
jgi:protein-tyrosine phosphatase